MKLTKRAVENLPTPEKDRRLYWDDRLAGFGVAVMASGKRSFVLQTRVNGRSRRITIGRFGQITVDLARSKAERLIGEIAGGGDPVKAKARRKAEAVTLGQALDDYLESRRNMKPATAADMRKKMNACFSKWMGRELNTLTPDLVKRRHAKVGAKAPALANLGTRYLRAVFNFAIAEYSGPDGEPVLSHNPVAKISATRAWYKVDRRRRVIKRHELEPWVGAVQALDNDLVRDYLMLTLLTGLRRSEGLGLRWADIDFAGETLTIPDPKNREAHTLPLSDYLRDLLSARHALRFAVDESGRLNDFVFESPRGPLTNLRYGLRAVKKASGVEFSIHDLRRTFATVAEALDIPSYAVKALLNHKMAGDVTAGYLVIDAERLRGPMQRVTDYMLTRGGLREPRAESETRGPAEDDGKVVDLEERRKQQAH